MDVSTVDEGAGPGRRLLLTGTPGCGKRSLGNLLAVTHPFAHVDLDSPRRLHADADALVAELEAVLEESPNVVATWTPRSEDDLALPELLQANGFEWIWLDGDRGAALHAAFADLGHLSPRLVDAFEPDGTFRPLERVLAEVLEAVPVGGRPARLADARLQPAR